ncbi:hypothetical protein GCM10023085_81480 [Actinomadura viridis]|uniref:Pyrroloquinoline-quinone binding quinoprotein n=1 Tax=Actinomadura viridis TaxID=58110 RepID=A0A931GIK3_9ACTN|nr:DUF6528 family protein [Actinomadura viridis]MBG6088142.1 hypothetical protein [Actinomadura viridis]
MLRNALTVLAGTFLGTAVLTAPAQAAVPAARLFPTPTRPGTPNSPSAPSTPGNPDSPEVPPGFVPRTDPLPAGLRASLATPARPGGKAAGLVIGGDQGSRRVVVMNARTRAWTAESAKWSWAPGVANGFGDVVAGWGLPSDVRVRAAKGKRYVLAADSKGFLGAVAYPSGRRLWATDTGVLSNPHAVELLPNGNVAAAASTGGWIRVYAASRGPHSHVHAEYRLRGGHGVLWDPRRKVLWALGDGHLVSLKVGGTAGRPTLTEHGRVALPSHGGHDLAPVYGNRDRLWVTTNHGVYHYKKSARSFTTAYRHAGSVDVPIVKAVGDHPRTKQVVLTRPSAGCATTWCTDTAEFFGGGRRAAVRTLKGAQFYKVRWFAPAYQ